MTDTTMQLLSQGTDPVKMPDFDILAEGKTLSGVAERLMSLSLTDNRGFEADQLTITLDDADGQLQLPPRGARLTVLIGWKGEPLTEKGTYIVDEIAHEGPPDRLTVSARSADFRDEFNVKREVSWHDVTVERVVSAIAHRYGLKPQISEMLMDIEIDHADQTEESDMSFLTRMAEMLGAITTVKSGNLLFIMPGGGVNAQGQPLPSFAITRSSGDRHQFRIADREAYTGYALTGLILITGKRKSQRETPQTEKGEKQQSGRRLYGRCGRQRVCVTQDLSERAGSKTCSSGKVAAATTRSRIILHHAGAWTRRTLPRNAWHGNRI